MTHLKYADIRYSEYIKYIQSKKISFKKRESAIKYQKKLFERYIRSVLFQHAEDLSFFVLWIKHFDLTREEVERGYRGNYGRFEVKQLEDGYFYCTLEKIITELVNHPERRGVKHSYPNWGVIVLKEVRKAKRYDTLEWAKMRLESLQEQYPKSSFFKNEKLHIRIFEREEKSSNQAIQDKTKMYILSIIENNNKFIIDYQEDKEENTFSNDKIDPYNFSTFII